MFGLDGSVILLILLLLIIFIPFILNFFLAQSRGKSVVLMLLLTIIFSWIVTLILACLPRVENHQRPKMGRDIRDWNDRAIVDAIFGKGFGKKKNKEGKEDKRNG